MPSRGRTRERPLGKRCYRKLFVVAVEGAETERQYFELLQKRWPGALLRLLKGAHRSAPNQVLDRLKRAIVEEDVVPPYEAWLVVDHDQRPDKEFRPLHDWASSQPHFGLALSNPMFEYWLLLHFEDGKGVSSPKQCRSRLKRCIPQYDKSIKPQNFPDSRIKEAIHRAKQRDNPPCPDWPRSVGTTVYKLVEKIQNA